MTRNHASRTERLVLLALAVGAWVVRASPYFRESGVLGWGVDYDEGVYLSASALLWRGVFPWRDFVFVHPPGVPVLLSFATAWDLAPSRALELARWAVTVVGALDVLLAALLVRRHAGFVGACVTAGLLAVWPEVVACDRGVHLEPFLTLACLSALWFLETEQPRPLSAGVCLGLGLLAKSWAVLWLAAWLIARGRRALPGVLVALVLTGLAVLPLLVTVPDFFAQTVGVHLWRPPDGDAGAALRLTEMFVSRSVLPLGMLLPGLVVLWQRRGDVFTRLLAVVTVLLVAAFLSAAAYWNQYNAHLAFPVAMLCGLVAQGPARAFSPRVQAWLAPALALAVALPGLVWVVDRRHDIDEGQRDRRGPLREALSRPDAVCTFEPQELILADRWPPRLEGTRALVDGYGQMLLDATRDGARFGSAAEAFQSEAAQRTLRAQLEACPFWFLGWHGRWQLNARSLEGLPPARVLDP